MLHIGACFIYPAYVYRIFAALQPLKTHAASFIGDLPAVNSLAGERGRRKVKRRKACKKGLHGSRGKGRERPRVRVSFDIQRGKYTISRSHKFSQSNERPFLSTRVAAALLMREQQCTRSVDITICVHARMHSHARAEVDARNCLSGNAEHVPIVSCCRKIARQTYRRVMRSRVKKKIARGWSMKFTILRKSREKYESERVGFDTGFLLAPNWSENEQTTTKNLNTSNI